MSSNGIRKTFWIQEHVVYCKMYTCWASKNWCMGIHWVLCEIMADYWGQVDNTVFYNIIRDNNWFCMITTWEIWIRFIWRKEKKVKHWLCSFSKLLPPPNSRYKSYPQCQKWKEAHLNLQWLATLALPHLPLLVPCLSPAPPPSLAIPTQEVKNTSGLLYIRDQ